MPCEWHSQLNIEGKLSTVYVACVHTPPEISDEIPDDY